MIYMNKNLNNLIADLQEKDIISTEVYFDNLFDFLSFLSYDQYLIVAKNNYFIDLLKSIRVYDDESVIVADSMVLPSIYCELDNIVFNNEFDKLVLKVRNSVNKDKKITMNRAC